MGLVWQRDISRLEQQVAMEIKAWQVILIDLPDVRSYSEVRLLSRLTECCCRGRVFYAHGQPCMSASKCVIMPRRDTLHP